MEAFLKKYWPLALALVVLAYLLYKCRKKVCSCDVIEPAPAGGGAIEPVITPEPVQPAPGPTIPDSGCITHYADDGTSYISCV